MDAMAAFGSIIITGGANATLLVPPPPDLNIDATQPLPGRTPEQVEVLDQYFAGAPVETRPPLGLALLVATSGLMTLKGIFLDEGERRERDRREEEEELDPRLVLIDQPRAP